MFSALHVHVQMLLLAFYIICKSRKRNQILVLDSELVELRKMNSLNRNSCSSLHARTGKDKSSSENKHNGGMFGFLATTLNRGVAIKQTMKPRLLIIHGK